MVVEKWEHLWNFIVSMATRLAGLLVHVFRAESSSVSSPANRSEWSVEVTQLAVLGGQPFAVPWAQAPLSWPHPDLLTPQLSLLLSSLLS